MNCTDIYKEQKQQKEWERKSFSNPGFEKHCGDPMCLESDLYPQEFKDQCEKEVKRKKKTETREVKRDPKKFGPLHRN